MMIRFMILLVISSFSCNNSEIYTKEKQVKTTSELTGIWSISSEEVNHVISMCNSCPKVEFRDDGTGRFIRSSKTTSEFTFTLSRENRIAISLEESNPVFFQNANYSYQIFKENDFERLEITLLDKSSKTTLKRAIE